MSLHANYYTNRGANPDDIAEPRKLTELELEIAEVNAHDIIVNDDTRLFDYLERDEVLSALRDLYESWAKPNGRKQFSPDEYRAIIANLSIFMDALWEPVFEAEKQKILEDNPNG